MWNTSVTHAILWGIIFSFYFACSTSGGKIILCQWSVWWLLKLWYFMHNTWCFYLFYYRGVLLCSPAHFLVCWPNFAQLCRICHSQLFRIFQRHRHTPDYSNIEQMTVCHFLHIKWYVHAGEIKICFEMLQCVSMYLQCT